MLQYLKKSWGKKRLLDQDYRFMFEPSPQDEWVCFDCETSSLDVYQAELLSIGAYRIKNNRIITSQSLSLLIKPEQDISASSIKIHHLRQQDLQGGVAVIEAIEQFLQFIGSRALVGYYLEFDVAMINKYLLPWLGIKLPNQQVDISALYYDYRLAKLRSHPYIGNVDLRFETIRKELSIPFYPKHHANNDALMTAMMFLELHSRLKENNW